MFSFAAACCKSAISIALYRRCIRTSFFSPQERRIRFSVISVMSVITLLTVCRRLVSGVGLFRRKTAPSKRDQTPPRFSFELDGNTDGPQIRCKPP